MSPSAPESSFTFLHAADLHLDSPLTGLSKYPGAPADSLREATRDAFVKLVELAIEERIAFVVLAGDLFDGDWADFNSGLWFNRRLRELGRHGITVFVIRGNHDAENRVTKKLPWPENVKVFSAKKPETHRLDGFDVALHGQSFQDASVFDNLALEYPDAIDGVCNIGVLHTSLQGGYDGHEPYAPCSLSDLASKGYDYWALGHVHQRQVVSEDPWVVFPGNLQGRHARELGPKGATLVSVEEGRITSAKHVDCDVARWARVELDLEGVDSEAEAMSRLGVELAAAVKLADGRLVAARIVLVGSTELHADFRLRPERTVNLIRNEGAACSDELWIEKVLVETTQPSAGREKEAVDDLLSKFAQRLDGSQLTPAALDRISGELRKVSNRLPKPVLETLDPAESSDLQRAAPEALEYLRLLLTGTPDQLEDSEVED